MALSSDTANTLIAGLTAGGILLFFSIYVNYEVFRDSKKKRQEEDARRTANNYGNEARGKRTRRKQSK